MPEELARLKFTLKVINAIKPLYKGIYCFIECVWYNVLSLYWIVALVIFSYNFYWRGKSEHSSRRVGITW